VGARLDAQLHLREARPEIGHARDHELGGHERDRADAQHLGLAATAQAPGGALQVGEQLLHVVQVLAPLHGEHDCARAALEQAQTERLLERLDLLADRRRRQVQLARRALEAAATRRRLESRQELQWRQACGRAHCIISYDLYAAIHCKYRY
jgi:hypothetical protein